MTACFSWKDVESNECCVFPVTQMLIGILNASNSHILVKTFFPRGRFLINIYHRTDMNNFQDFTYFMNNDERKICV
jgi:hypothetical protein